MTMIRFVYSKRST